jgi:hypothetical protein
MAAPARCAQIVGKIDDSQGTPISNIEVVLIDAVGRPVRNAFTDARGIFKLHGLNPGDYRIQFLPLTGGQLGNTLPLHLPPSGLSVRWKAIPATPSLVRTAVSMPVG